MRRKRLLLYAALALAVPVPAFALGLAGSSSPAPGSLDAQASLDTCGIFEQQIVCKVDVAFNQVAGADRYAANVTGPDGSVADYGDVGPGGTSLWVPYVGDGTYTVTVQAWGKPPSSDKQPKLLSADKVAATSSSHINAGGGVPTRRLQGTTQAVSPDQRGGGRFGTDQSTTDTEQGTGGDTTSTPPTCVPPTPPDNSGDTGSGTTGSDATGSPDASAPAAGSAATLGGSDAAVLESQGQVPQAVTPPACPDGSQPTDGSCCPAPTTP